MRHSWHTRTNHTVDELFLAASLEDTWQTPLAIKREFKILGEAQKIASVLERLDDRFHETCIMEPMV
jgi:hypothetical protein